MAFSRLIPLTFVGRTIITPKIMLVQFEKPANFSFRGGQFVQFSFPTEQGPVLRIFSIASPPDKDRLEFCVKILPGGVSSQHFLKSVPGDVVYVSPPGGSFVLKTKPDQKAVFVATGTGIAPVNALLSDRLKEVAAPTTLLFGMRHEDDLFWHDSFTALTKKHPHFSYQVTLSRPSPAWDGHTGRVTVHLPGHVDVDAHYYLAGSVEMVRDVRAELASRGVNTKNVHTEIF